MKDRYNEGYQISIDVVSYYTRKPKSDAIQENAFSDIINYNYQITRQIHYALK